MPLEEMYSVEEIADKLKRTPETVRDYIRSGAIKGYIVGKGYLIKESDFKEFLEERLIRFEEDEIEESPTEDEDD